MATIQIENDSLQVRLTGWDRLLAIKGGMKVPLSDVTGVAVDPPEAQYDSIKGLRLWGGYWPKKFAAGYFWLTREGVIAWYFVRDPKRAVRIDLKGQPARFLVIEDEKADPEVIAELVRKAIGAAASSASSEPKKGSKGASTAA
jgi:hypothetical protein